MLRQLEGEEGGSAEERYWPNYIVCMKEQVTTNPTNIMHNKNCGKKRLLGAWVGKLEMMEAVSLLVSRKKVLLENEEGLALSDIRRI